MSDPHDDGGPVGYPTFNQESLQAPWTPTQVRAIEAWQAAGTVHPLTCITHSDHPMTVRSAGLYCEKCGYEQTWVPRMCAEMFPSDFAPPLPDLNEANVRYLVDQVAEAINKQTAERVAALVIAIRLMEMHLELATPGGAGRDSIAWTVAQRRLTVLRELMEELRATQPEQPSVD